MPLEKQTLDLNLRGDFTGSMSTEYRQTFVQTLYIKYYVEFSFVYPSSGLAFGLPICCLQSEILSKHRGMFLNPLPSMAAIGTFDCTHALAEGK